MKEMYFKRDKFNGRSEWELQLSLSFRVDYFKHVVATEAAFDVFEQVVYFFESQANPTLGSDVSLADNEDGASKKRVDIPILDSRPRRRKVTKK